MLTYAEMMSRRAPVVMGLKLRPLSLGHVMHMQANNCVFLSPVKVHLFVEDPVESIKRFNNVTLELLLACLISSLTYEDFLELVEDEQTFIKQMSKWSKAVNKMSKKGHLNLLEEINRFVRYLEEGYQVPEYDDLRKEKASSGSSKNWPHTVTATNCAEFNMTKSEVFNQPLNVTLLDFFKSAERNGLIHLMNDDEQHLARAAVEQLKGGFNVS